MEIEVIGIDKLNLKLSKLTDNNKIKSALQRVGLEIENEAKANCPAGTGALRRSIRSEVSDASSDTITVEIGTNLEYAPYVEYGTGIFATAGNGRQTPWSYQSADGEWHTTQGQQAQPFLLPAFNNKKNQVIDYLTNELDI